VTKWEKIWENDRIEYSEEHKDKFEKKSCDKIPILYLPENIVPKLIQDIN